MSRQYREQKAIKTITGINYQGGTESPKFLNGCLCVCMSAEQTDTKIKFTEKLIEFYKEFTAGTSKSIKLLADIQKDYPNEYEKLQDLYNNPEVLSDMVGDMKPEVKDALILVIIKASAIGKKTSKLFELTADEKYKLAQDLTDYAKFVEQKAKEIKEIQKNLKDKK